jgi:MOSC domain-containing protein YiiM
VKVRGTVVQINISRGGVPKLPIARAEVQPEGIVGDWQRDRRLHGGPLRALCLWSFDIIEALQREGHPVSPGSTGENLTIRGLPWAALRPGVELRIGASVRLEITDYATPCRTIWKSFSFRRYGRIGQKRYPGQSRLYARVLASGAVVPGDEVLVP